MRNICFLEIIHEFNIPRDPSFKIRSTLHFFSHRKLKIKFYLSFMYAAVVEQAQLFFYSQQDYKENL